MRISIPIAVVAALFSLRGLADSPPPEPQWSINATVIESCSCPMFCQCQFNGQPAAHAGTGEHAGHAMHFCKFNNAYKINSGAWGDTRLDGAKFWVYGDLGGNFGSGTADWIVVTFDPSVPKEAREGIQKIFAHIFPLKWNNFSVGEDKPVEWTADKDKAHASLDGGKIAEISLKTNKGFNGEPVMIKNLPYMAARAPEGFILMQNEFQTLRQAPADRKPYEFKGTTGFMTTFELTSKDAQAAANQENPKP